MSRLSLRPSFGFTILELIVTLGIISILAAITIVAYGTWQHRIADNTVMSDTQQAATSLESYKNYNNDYPPNLAGTNFAPSYSVVLTMTTNAPQTRTYSGLTSDQNAQLLLNTCNANMPIKSADGSITYNTSCAFAGSNLHIPGANGSNVLIHGPTVIEAEFVLSCGATCDTASAKIISEFEAQGGTMPITVPTNQVALPPPTPTNYGSATDYCLEGRSVNFSDVIYHTTPSSTSPVAGPCPVNPSLHYP